MIDVFGNGWYYKLIRNLSKVDELYEILYY